MTTDTWLSGVSASWTQASAWSGGVPSAGTTASIAAAGSYLVTLFGDAAAAAVTLADSGAELYQAGVLALGATFQLQAGTLALEGGTIQGGTLAMDGGQFLSTGGTLSGVDVQGTLALTQAESTLVVQNGMALAGASGSGAGSIALTGGYASLDFQGSQTLNNATVSLGATGSLPGQTGAASLAVTHAGGVTSGATLTLGPHLWVRDAGGQGELVVGASSLLPGAGLPDTIINQGTITAGVAGSDLAITGTGTFINQGTIGISNGATLSIGAGGFSNTGSITVGSGTLALGGTFSAAELSGLGAVTLAGGQVEIAGDVTNEGGTLSLGAGSSIAGSLGALSLGGTITGGTVLDAGNGLSFAPGTGLLDGVTYAGTLNLGAANAAVTLTDGSEVETASGGAGIIVDIGAGAALLLRGSETLTNATITLGSGGAAAEIGTGDAWLASSATTATLGPSVTVEQTGANAALAANGWSPVPGIGQADTLVNQGTITAGVSGGVLAVSGYGTFINQGDITVANTDTMPVTVQQFANAGSLIIASGGVVQLGQTTPGFGTPPAWSNAGQIDVQGGTLVLGGAVTASQLGTIAETGAGSSVVLAGTLNNAGNTLVLGGGAGPVSLSALSLTGTIAGGTINDPSGVLAPGVAGGALLDGVTYNGTLAMTQQGGFLRVRDGLTLNGTAEVVAAGSLLDFEGSQTLRAGHILLGATGGAAAIGLMHDPSLSSGSTLTLGAAVTITQAGSLAVIGQAGGVTGDAIVNQGSITAATAGGTLTLGGPDFVNQGQITVSNADTLCISSQQFSNTGTITVSGGELSLGGSLMLAELGHLALSNGVLAVSGTLNLGGGTLAVGSGTSIGQLLLTGTISNGTIVDSGNGLAVSGDATLNDVAYDGTINLSRPFAQLSIGGGITLNATAGSQLGSIVVTGAQTRLIASTTETINRAAITLGGGAQTYNGQTLAAPEIAADPGATLTLGAATTLTEVGAVGTLGDSGLGQWSDSIVNAGQITAATAGATLTIGSTYFTNGGTLTASGGGTVVIADAGFTNTGVLSIGAGSGVSVTLYDFYAAPDSGPSVFTNAGTIQLSGGTLAEPTGNGLFPAVPLVGQSSGLIEGYGQITAQVANSGTIEALGGTLTLSQPVLGTGQILIGADSTLQLAGAVPAGETVKFSGADGTLKLEDLSGFSGKISGITAGETIDIAGDKLAGIGIANGTLAVNLAGTVYWLKTTTAVTGAIAEEPDGHGGSLLTITPPAGGSGSQGGDAPAVVAVPEGGMLLWASPTGDIFTGTSAHINGAHVGNWSAADSVDITDLSSTGASLSVTHASGLTVIKVSSGAHSTSFNLAGTFTIANFHLASDGSGGSILTY
jgi:hypothetical protein